MVLNWESLLFKNVKLLFYNDRHDFNITIEEKQDFGRHSTKVHQLLLTFVCWSKCLAESLQRGGSLCRVRCSFGYSEVEAQLRVEVVLRAGAHDVSVWVSARQSQIRR